MPQQGPGGAHCCGGLPPPRPTGHSGSAMTPSDELQLLHTGAGLVAHDGRAAVLVTGPDAVSLLQALVSADLDPLADGDGARSLLLVPQGKLDVAFRLLRVG